MIKTFKKFLKLAKKNRLLILILIIFLCELFLRFYQIEQKNIFNIDQVDNAWAAQNIIVDHKLPLVGMVAKANSGIYVGPAYYYMIAVFYWIFNLNPIASGIFAGVTSIFTFWTIYFVVKKLFSTQVAIFALIINTFTVNAIIFDRVQWPVNFIPGISLLIFYFLYKVIMGKPKNLLPLALLIGFAFNIHFTAIFFPIMVLLSLPFFPRTKETLKYILLSLPLFLVWLIPNIVYQLQQKSASSNFTNYFNTYYHGIHLRRIMQLTGDGLIQFDPYAISDKFLSFKFIAVPLFFALYLYKSIPRNKLLLCYLVLLWFIVPWFIFATYSGEISDYYFSTSRFIVLFILSYFMFRIWNINNFLSKILVIIILAYLVVNNFNKFLAYENKGLAEREKIVSEMIKKNEKAKFQRTDPESYLYYYLQKQDSEKRQ